MSVTIEESVEEKVEEDFNSSKKINHSLYKIDPLEGASDLRESPRRYEEIRCGCPCPKISAPVYAAGLVIFDPLK